MAVKETCQGTEVECLCWQPCLLLKSASTASVGASSGLLSMSKTLIFVMILPVFFIHIGHLGICVEKQSDFLPQDQFHVSNPCQTWHRQGWNPGPAKVNSNTPMGVKFQSYSQLFAQEPTFPCLPVCRDVCRKRYFFLTEEEELEGKWNKASMERILKVMLELLGMILLSLWKVCYKHC